MIFFDNLTYIYPDMFVMNLIF